MRYHILDGFRGFFLLFMGVIHLNEVLNVTIGKLNHHYFGWVEDAQGFVFISGLVVGIVYGKTYLHKGYNAMRGRVWTRARTIYLHQAGLILIFTLLAVKLGGLMVSSEILQPYLEEPIYFTATSLLLLSASTHMGILPMYIYFMLITPWVLRAFHAGYAPVIAMLMLLSWYLLGQTWILDACVRAMETVMAQAGHPVQLGLFFNIFAWQVLFFSGLWLGFMQVQNRLDLSFLHNKAWRVCFWVALGGAIGFGIWDRIVFTDFILPEISQKFLFYNSRSDFAVIYPVAFLVDLFLLTWLLVAGKSCGNVWIERCAQIVHWLFTRRALVFLGQHSLHVFSFHILMVYALSIVLDKRELSEFWGSVSLIAGVAALYIPAWLHALAQKRRQAVKR